ncbi:hypothetical protein RCH33_2637 [Flavobacterium daejeonense]|nr:hypothetical protein RCH33_2637 [Flavobacterium daejeonense]
MIIASITKNKRDKIGVKNINANIIYPAPHGAWFLKDSILKR